MDIKENIVNKNNRNLIIAIVIVFILAIGLNYYFGNKNKTRDVNTPNVIINDENTDTEEGENINITDEKALDSTDNVSAPLISSENTTNYNLAMTNASKSFNNKEYSKAIEYYNEALTYKKDDTAYMGLFTTYSAQGDWVRAKSAIDNAIKINPSYTDYWVSKLLMLDEKTNTTYGDMEKIYQEGLFKVDVRYKINLVTTFAQITEKGGLITQAINIWKYAQQVYPQNSAIYQAEIDRLTLTVQ